MRSAYPLHCADGSVIDGREALVNLRRLLTNRLNERKRLQDSLDSSCCNLTFVDIQHFYNSLTFAIQAFEEAYKSTSISLRK